MVQTITSPDDAAWEPLLALLRERWETQDNPLLWPHEQLQALGSAGVYTWFVPAEFGGQNWSEGDLLRGLVKLSSACLVTTFVLTQRVAAVSRIVAAENSSLRAALLPPLLTAESFATIGISHLTTSRRHVSTPVLHAQPTTGGYLLHGYSPWVTGANHAETMVIGAVVSEQEQLLLAVERRTPGVHVPEPESLVALGASHTGRVEFRHAFVAEDRLLMPPRQHVLQQGLTIRTGGSQTSALALGLADRSLQILEQEGELRHDLLEPAAALRAEWRQLYDDMLQLAQHNFVCTNEQLRQRANSLVLRASQAALAASKGAGYVSGHPAGRLCREALFFLVWSCPHPVTSAHLCELAGLS